MTEEQELFSRQAILALDTTGRVRSITFFSLSKNSITMQLSTRSATPEITNRSGQVDLTTGSSVFSMSTADADIDME